MIADRDGDQLIAVSIRVDLGSLRAAAARPSSLARPMTVQLDCGPQRRGYKSR